MKMIHWLIILLISLMGSLVNAADFDAKIDFLPQVELSLPVSGLIKTLKVSTGQRVAKGDELLSFDQVLFTAARVRAQSQVTVQKTILTQSQRDFEQQKELYDRTVLATVELEDAELRLKRDQANLEAAQAQLATANYILSYSKLKAPFDAIIMSVNVNQGQYVNNKLQGKTLISITRQGHYQIRFNVPLAEVDNIRVDQSVTIKVAGKVYPGKVSSIDYRTVDGSEGKWFAVAAEFIAQGKTMLIGQKASVHIE